MRGNFIVLEGLDGSGKSTQLSLIADALRARGRRVALTEEPTPTAIGGIIRDALSRRCERTTDELAALFLADRVQHNAGPGGIRALTEAGFDVLCHRYYYSSFVYQGTRTDESWVREMNLSSPSIMKPDICVFIDTPPEVCLERVRTVRASRDIFEEKLETLRGAREAFLRVFASLPDHRVVRVDGALPEGEVAAAAVRAIESALL